MRERHPPTSAKLGRRLGRGTVHGGRGQIHGGSARHGRGLRVFGLRAFGLRAFGLRAVGLRAFGLRVVGFGRRRLRYRRSGRLSGSRPSTGAAARWRHQRAFQSSRQRRSGRRPAWIRPRSCRRSCRSARVDGDGARLRTRIRCGSRAFEWPVQRRGRSQRLHTRLVLAVHHPSSITHPPRGRQVPVPWLPCPGTSSAAAPAATLSRSTVRWRRPATGHLPPGPRRHGQAALRRRGHRPGRGWLRRWCPGSRRGWLLRRRLRLLTRPSRGPTGGRALPGAGTSGTLRRHLPGRSHDA